MSLSVRSSPGSFRSLRRAKLRNPLPSAGCSLLLPPRSGTTGDAPPLLEAVVLLLALLPLVLLLELSAGGKEGKEIRGLASVGRGGTRAHPRRR